MLLLSSPLGTACSVQDLENIPTFPSMAKSLSVLALACSSLFSGLAQAQISPVVVNSTPVNASAPIPEAFVSFSIEFSFFPDYAGTLSNPAAVAPPHSY